MCNVTELLVAKRKIQALEAQLTSETARLISDSYIDVNDWYTILTAKLAEMGDSEAELYLADSFCKIYNRIDVIEFLGLNTVDKIVFVAESMDCDDFAAEVYGKGLPLIWTNKHALNWFIDENASLWFVEPQTDKMARNLDNWQGWDVRFFLAR